MSGLAEPDQMRTNRPEEMFCRPSPRVGLQARYLTASGRVGFCVGIPTKRRPVSATIHAGERATDDHHHRTDHAGAMTSFRAVDVFIWGGLGVLASGLAWLRTQTDMAALAVPAPRLTPAMGGRAHSDAGPLRWINRTGAMGR